MFKCSRSRPPHTQYLSASGEVCKDRLKNNQLTVCSGVHSTLETFSGITSLHGVPRIINSRSMTSRLFWSAVFVFAVFMFIYTGTNLLEQYFSYPKKVNVEIVQTPVPFPSVTLCNTDILDFLMVERLEKEFITEDVNDQLLNETTDLEENQSQISEIYETTTHFSRNKNNEFRKSYLKFQSTISILPHLFSLGNIDFQQAMKEQFVIMSRLGLVANVGPHLASKAGIRAEDFIVYCRFMEEDCNVTNTFVKIFDPYFFNCFTFEPQRILHSKSTRLAGIEYGLTLLLFSGSAGELTTGSGDSEPLLPGLIEADPARVTKQGAKVVIHSQNSIPHFTTDGYDIPSGFSVSIGIKARQNVRVSLPHGNCTNEDEYRRTSGSKSQFKYTLISCQNECIQSSIAEACHCIDNRMPYRQDELESIDRNMHIRHKKTYRYGKYSNVSKERNLPFCLELPTIPQRCRRPETMEDTPECKEVKREMGEQFTARSTCRRHIHDRMTVKQPELIEACKCYPPCRDVVYDTLYSISRLPDKQRRNSAIYAIVDNYLRGLPEERNKALKRRYGDDYLNEVISKISRLNVHIADNNIIKTTESPDYDFVRLVSDIGGQMGLWIGISVITLVEVIQLLADIGVILIKKGKSFLDLHVLDKSIKNETKFEKNHNLIERSINATEDEIELRLHNGDILLNKLSSV